MKKSKKIITRFIQNICKNYLPVNIYSFFLFLRFRNKFKRSINRKKSFENFSSSTDLINKHEYKISSQNNEDGIINYIFKIVPNKKKFIEIGIGYYEFNSLNLINNNWTGLIIEQNYEECLILKRMLNSFYPESQVNILRESVNKKNINELVNKQNFIEKIDFFSIDIDGNDYWVLKELDLKNISCVCLEYNHWLGNKVEKTIPYNENLDYTDNGFFGASLLAFNNLMNSKNFKLIAVDSSGTNAFFIQNKFSHLFEVLDPIKSFKSVGRLYSKEKRQKIFSDVKKFNFIDAN